MQSLPAVTSSQATSSSGPADLANATSQTGPGFAQVLGEQTSRSSPPASAHTDRPAAAKASTTSTTSAAPNTVSNASAGGPKKTTVSATHVDGSSQQASAIPVASTQSVPPAAAQPAALNSATAANVPPDPATATGAEEGTDRIALSVHPSARTSVSSPVSDTAKLPSLAQSAPLDGDEEGAPMSSIRAKEDGDSAFTGLGEDSMDGATGGAMGDRMGASMAALHGAAAFSSSLAQAKAYMGSGGDHAKSENDADELHIAQATNTAAPVSSIAPTTALSASAAVGSPEATAVTCANVPYPMGSDAWRADVSSHVLYFTQQNLTEAQLHLNPAHLGPLEVTIKSDNNQTTLAFSAAHEATRQAMQDSLPQLRHLFAAQGVSLGHTSVSDQSQGSGNTKQENTNARQAPGAQSPLSCHSVATQAIALSSLSVIDTFA